MELSLWSCHCGSVMTHALQSEAVSLDFTREVTKRGSSCCRPLNERRFISSSLCPQDRDLDCKIGEVRRAGRSLPESQVIDWLIQLLLGLCYIHDRCSFLLFPLKSSLALNVCPAPHVLSA